MLSYEAALKQHYAGVSSRLRGPEPVRVCRVPVELDDDPEPIPPAVQRIHIISIEELPPETPIIPIPRWKLIAREVARKHGLTVRELIGPWRNERFVIARHEAMYRCWKETNMSFPNIGRVFGGRDHTSALHAIRRHEERIGLVPSKLTRREVRWTLEKIALVRKLRASGCTWAQVGERVGVSERSVRSAMSRERDRLRRAA